MRIAIVDDISEERKLLQDRLEVWLLRYTLCAEIFQYKSGKDFLTAASKTPFSLVFLDIYMDGSMDGIKAAEKLRAFDTDCILVFTTTSTNHALEGFRVRAMHYLVKPYSDEDIGTLFAEVIKRMPMPEKFIHITTTGGVIRLPYRNILYAEHFQHRIYIHTTNEKEIISRQTFREFSRKLNDERFFLCNRGVIINMEHAQDFNGSSFLMANGRSVQVSRKLTKNARNAFGNYLFSGVGDR